MISRAACLACILVAALVTTAHAQSTAFTYQGRLKDGTQLAAGPYDFRFTLFNALTGGVVVAPVQCVDNVTVTEGLFNTTIDFGQAFTATAGLFIQIEARADTGLGCGDATGLIVLSPRQAVTAAPMATHAKAAYALDAADGSPANAVFVDNAGNVGIGTTTPTHSVTIANPAPTIALQDTGPTQVGYVSYRDSANTETAWVGYGSEGDPDFSIVNVRAGGDIVLNPFNGNVGIGTATPAVRLEVRGDIKLGASGQYFASSGEENLRTVRGTANGNGTVAFGSGWTVARTAAGSYTVFFNTPFGDRPSVVVSSSLSTRTAAVGTPVQGNVAVRLFNSAGVLTDDTFYFIATGPR